MKKSPTEILYRLLRARKEYERAKIRHADEYNCDFLCDRDLQYLLEAEKEFDDLFSQQRDAT